MSTGKPNFRWPGIGEKRRARKRAGGACGFLSSPVRIAEQFSRRIEAAESAIRSVAEARNHPINAPRKKSRRRLKYLREIDSPQKQARAFQAGGASLAFPLSGRFSTFNRSGTLSLSSETPSRGGEALVAAGAGGASSFHYPECESGFIRRLFRQLEMQPDGHPGASESPRSNPAI